MTEPVDPAPPPPSADATRPPIPSVHLGEALPGAPLVLLVGRPNCGKSSLFNATTGGHAHVGNFPGVTVDVLEEELALPSGTKITLADLPGFYSMEAIVDDDTDEGVARRFIDKMQRSGRPLLVVQVLDATHLALHLKLTRELRALGLPLLVAASQSDLLARTGAELHRPELERAVGAPVVVVSARSPKAKATMLAAIERALVLPVPEPGTFDVADAAARAVTAPEASARRVTATERTDAVLLHPIIGPALFVMLMSALFAAVFLVADPATEVLDGAIAFLRARIESALGRGVVSSFVSDGILGGAGTVLAFLPQIVVLTVSMEILEASGYLARGAFLVDRLLRLMGLSGRSFLPLLMGHACAIPAINATRIVRDPKERLTAMLVLPLMTCSARIPTYALIVGTFFFRASVLTKAAIFVSLYFAGLLAGLVASLVIRRTTVKGTSLPLVLEMPAYRRPQVRVVLRQAARAAVRFLREVGTTIVLASSILWAVLTLPSPFAGPAVEGTPPIERSVAASVGRGLEPITRPLGFDWRLNVGLIGSFGARELMVGTLGIINGIDDAGADPSPLSERLRTAKRPDGQPQYPARTGLAILAFFVLACQCMSTVAAVKRETRSYKWPAFLLAYTYAAAYVAAFVVHGLAKLAGF